MACLLLLAFHFGKFQKRRHSVLKLVFLNLLGWVHLEFQSAPIVLIYYFAMQIVYLDQIATGYQFSGQRVVSSAFAFLGNCSTNPSAVGGMACSHFVDWVWTLVVCRMKMFNLVSSFCLWRWCWCSLFYKCCLNIWPAPTRNHGLFCVLKVVPVPSSPMLVSGRQGVHSWSLLFCRLPV